MRLLECSILLLLVFAVCPAEVSPSDDHYNIHFNSFIFLMPLVNVNIGWFIDEKKSNYL